MTLTHSAFSIIWWHKTFFYPPPAQSEVGDMERSDYGPQNLVHFKHLLAQEGLQEYGINMLRL